ncbi:alpha/beta-hydrolase [Melanomma pulvis-pyrius CBS 109.77]|uniref:Alpha/beta-hydrolase n=1 Tax=Melanomma pulvis-pyrius CBS 109.77 TaxID=1314802 RepID=A0A6A6WYG9_9PLEO|nr:alpha/beta-hydrolase [Melanomma pulvis-pyrius CBS 109.77]
MPFFQHEDITLFYTDEGTGTPVLLLHGWACDSHDWSFQIPLLISLNFRVIALDQRGHGRSSVPQSTDNYAPRAFADDAFALLKHLETGPAIVIGHSMGTIITSVLAVEYPDAIKALVLVHPIYSGVPDALPIMAEAMRAEPYRAPEMAADFFAKVMYTKQTPEWLKTWQIRRTLGVDPITLVGSITALVKVFGSVMGQSKEAKAFMRKRKGPRLAVCTMEAAPGWEREIGIEEGADEIFTMTEGTFSHMVESEKFNKVLGDWLKTYGHPANHSI